MARHTALRLRRVCKSCNKDVLAILAPSLCFIGGLTMIVYGSMTGDGHMSDVQMDHNTSAYEDKKQQAFSILIFGVVILAMGTFFLCLVYACPFACPLCNAQPDDPDTEADQAPVLGTNRDSKQLQINEDTSLLPRVQSAQQPFKISAEVVLAPR